MRPLLGRAAVNLVFEEPPGIPGLHTDQGKVAQVLRNFINVSGILSGRAVHAAADELSRLDEMFQDGRPRGHPAG